MGAPYVIVWDLDETLGSFTGIADARERDAEARIVLRPGLRGALERLLGEGFVHTVLTLAMPNYAEAALRGAGLRELFVEVKGRGQRPKGDAAGVAVALGMAPEEMPHRMLFVGDHPWLDPPADERVLFHLETRALSRDASLVADLALGLRARGQGSLAAGFSAVLAEGADGAAAASGPVARHLEGVGALWLVARDNDPPVVALHDDTPNAGEAGEAHVFAPWRVYPDGFPR